MCQSLKFTNTSIDDSCKEEEKKMILSYTSEIFFFRTMTQVECTRVPELSFCIKTFERRILSKDAIDDNITWHSANLHMCDAYGGPTRCVVVHIAWALDNVLLKSVESLSKYEFEDLFGFGCGRFEKGRIISFARNVLSVY